MNNPPLDNWQENAANNQLAPLKLAFLVIGTAFFMAIMPLIGSQLPDQWRIVKIGKAPIYTPSLLFVSCRFAVVECCVHS